MVVIVAGRHEPKLVGDIFAVVGKVVTVSDGVAKGILITNEPAIGIELVLHRRHPPRIGKAGEIMRECRVGIGKTIGLANAVNEGDQVVVRAVLVGHPVAGGVHNVGDSAKLIAVEGNADTVGARDRVLPNQAVGGNDEGVAVGVANALQARNFINQILVAFRRGVTE